MYGLTAINAFGPEGIVRTPLPVKSRTVKPEYWIPRYGFAKVSVVPDPRSSYCVQSVSTPAQLLARGVKEANATRTNIGKVQGIAGAIARSSSYGSGKDQAHGPGQDG